MEIRTRQSGPRVFINHSGLRPAEPSSLAVAATHHTLTHLTLNVAKHVHMRAQELSSLGKCGSSDHHQHQQLGMVVSSGQRPPLTPKGTAASRHNKRAADLNAVEEEGGRGGVVSRAPPQVESENMLRGNVRDVFDAASMVTTATVSGVSKVRYRIAVEPVVRNLADDSMRLRSLVVR